VKSYKTALSIKRGYNKVEFPEKAFNYITGFGVIFLRHGEEILLESGTSEVALVIFGGTCDITLDGKTFKGLGRRKTVFDDLPSAIYVPRDTKYVLKGYDAEIGICSARCDKRSKFAVISPEDIKIMQVGRDNWQREVRMIIGDNSPSVNLIVGETINPAGNWSGTPPHRHETLKLPQESLHEELYYFKMAKPGAFGIQRIYSPERGVEETILLKNNEITFIPWGYHQIVAGPGYKMYYLFLLAGEGKRLAGCVDPDHSWLIKNNEEVKDAIRR